MGRETPPRRLGADRPQGHRTGTYAGAGCQVPWGCRAVAIGRISSSFLCALLTLVVCGSSFPRPASEFRGHTNDWTSLQASAAPAWEWAVRGQ